MALIDARLIICCRLEFGECQVLFFFTEFAAICALERKWRMSAWKTPIIRASLRQVFKLRCELLHFCCERMR